MVDAKTEPVDLSVSLVVFRPDIEQLNKTLESLRRSIVSAGVVMGRRFSAELFLVDNGGLPALRDVRDKYEACGISWNDIGQHGNVGFGRGHNLALDRICGRYHLVLNPDVEFDGESIAHAIKFLDSHSSVGLFSPRITGADGGVQYLCRRYPSVVDLFLRGFIPVQFRRFFAKRLAHYEMRDVINDHDIVWDPPIVSGCFMLFRTDVLKKLGGFDPRYFLYFEDYDLSLRTHDVARVAYVPSVRVIHHGGGASRKGFAHIRMFAASAFKFYNRFGWRLW
ncbi:MULTISPECIES: glycosyltransferase family 2 protein [Burkholderia]|uniref:glycosyltransferase family 2 protein n=1 Tax=Burkholderia TaxID=32008 RepID=UPI00093154C3|nr:MULTISPECIES: glycosyltransferase family 2 protein [Burkholderia]